MSSRLSNLLEPIAAWFSQFGLPEPIVHWGHPLMMGIVVFAMGSVAGIAGWRGRLAQDEAVAVRNRVNHRRIVLWMFLFISLGYTGGLLSLVMQGKPVLESPHFWTGSLVIGLLGLNGVISKVGFRKTENSDPSSPWRTVHAYLGSMALGLLFIHAFLGLKLGLSI